MIDIGEKKLIEQCISGDPISQKKLYDRFAASFYAICLRYAIDDEEAQDILQESFVKIFRNLGQFNFLGSFEGWMKRIVVNTAIEYYRKRKDNISIDDINVSSIPSSPFVDNIDISILYKLISELPLGFRTIFNLYVIEGYTHDEISKKLDISIGTSKSQLSRARAILQEKIKKLNN